MSQPQFENIHAMSSQERPHPIMRSRSNTSTSSAQQRPKSRGSTTSLPSVGVGGGYQPHPEQQVLADQNAIYMQHGHPSGQPTFPQSAEEALMHHFQMTQPQQLEAHMAMQPHDMRPPSQHGFQDMSHYPMSYPTNGMPQFGIPQASMQQQHMHHMRHQSEQFEGSPAPDDSNTETGGARRKKGTASSAANDQELRKLLLAYQNKTLKEVAEEVQKNEGSGANLKGKTSFCNALASGKL